MADITASLVKKLRDMTGQAMMDCKKALEETGGELEKAVDLLRKKGMAVMEKRGERETSEGRVVGKVSPDGRTAVLTMLCSETDFTSKNENFQQAAQILADALLQADAAPATTDELSALPSGSRTVGDIVNDIVSTTGEKITIGQFARFDLDTPGLLFAYVHFNGKIGTLLEIEAENSAAAQHEATSRLANDIAMHITALNPVGVDRSAVDQALVEREREVAREQVKGKPENMIEKIVDGKLNKWYKQIVLLEQDFVKDDSRTVQQVVDETAQQAGGKLTVKRFARFQIG